MINSVTLTGRLTREVEVRFTQNGTAVASGSLAVNRRFKQEGQPEADFFNIVVWGKQAEVLADHTTKGSLIGVEGRLQTRNYENAEGNRIYVTEVVVENFAFLETKKEDAAPAPQSKPQYKNGGKSYQKR
jgi:single-strand DNA-binding protein